MHLYRFQDSFFKIDRSFQMHSYKSLEEKEALLFLKVQCLKKMLHFKESLQCVEDLLRDMKEESVFFKKILLERVDIYLQMKRYADMQILIKDYQKYEWSLEEKNCLLKKRAKAFFRQGCYEKAFLLWEKLLKNWNNSLRSLQKEEIYLFMGLCCYNLCDYGKALGFFQKIEKLSPQYALKTYYYMAWCFISLGKKERGISLLYKMLGTKKPDPLKADIFLWLSDHYAFQKNIKKQKECLFQIINNYKQTHVFGEACYQMALLDIRDKNYDEALNRIDKINPDQEIYQEALLTGMEL